MEFVHHSLRFVTLLLVAAVLPSSPAHAGSQFAAVAAGGYASCGLTNSGGVKCWGLNAGGGLGDGTYNDSLVPVEVTGLQSGVTAIVMGDSHACALTAVGGVKCWGSNNAGQLGDGTTTNRALAADVTGLTSGVTALAAGADFTCALLSSGAVKCWGRNDNGQLGDGVIAYPFLQKTPVDVSGLQSGITSIVTGRAHACAVTATHAMKCWGFNQNGQLGDGTTINRSTPAEIPGLNDVSAAGSGAWHTCAISSSGAVKCWGYNVRGQLGDGSTQQQNVPVAVPGVSNVTSVVGGWYHTCAQTAAGAMQCWGDNASGQIGDGTLVSRPAPAAVQGLSSGAVSIAAGWYHSCAAVTGQGIKCWGFNEYGQLGDGTTTDRPVPTPVESAWLVGIAAGGWHTCAITASRGMRCWGANSFGQLGDGTANNQSAPVDVTGLGSGIAQIAPGTHHTCALTSDGSVQCWGWNQYGQLGNGLTANSALPSTVSGLASGVIAIASGGAHSCAILSAGTVKCWGKNDYGQLGDGTFTERHTPVTVTGLSGTFTSITAGDRHTCVVSNIGAAKCWGFNADGELGNGTVAFSTTPVDVSGLSTGVSTISAGMAHTCAKTASGVKCWGANAAGQLGDGSYTNRLAPVSVSGLADEALVLSTGGQHTCVVTAQHGAKCWGRNDAGQLGDGTTYTRTAPVDVATLASGVSTISGGYGHTCAIVNSQAAKCWGANSFGQLGDGTTTLSPVPIGVLGRYDIEGTVRFNGTGLPGVIIDAGALGVGITDRLGYYRLPQIVEGTKYTLTPAKEGYVFTPRSISSTLEGDVVEDFSAAVVPSTPTPTPTPPLAPWVSDPIRPQVKAYRIKIRPQRMPVVRYRVSDNSGASQEIIRIKRNNRVKKTIATDLAPIPAGGQRKVPCRINYHASGEFSYCVTAVDAAGNSSRESCAKIRLVR